MKILKEHVVGDSSRLQLMENKNPLHHQLSASMKVLRD
jgi:hypothetical protein